MKEKRILEIPVTASTGAYSEIRFVFKERGTHEQDANKIVQFLLEQPTASVFHYVKLKLNTWEKTGKYEKEIIEGD